MFIKRLVLVTGDEYNKVEFFTEIPIWFKENVPEQFIGVKSDTFEVFISTSMIASVEFDNRSKLQVISS